VGRRRLTGSVPLATPIGTAGRFFTSPSLFHWSLDYAYSQSYSYSRLDMVVSHSFAPVHRKLRCISSQRCVGNRDVSLWPTLSPSLSLQVGLKCCLWLQTQVLIHMFQILSTSKFTNRFSILDEVLHMSSLHVYSITKITLLPNSGSISPYTHTTTLEEESYARKTTQPSWNRGIPILYFISTTGRQTLLRVIS